MGMSCCGCTDRSKNVHILFNEDKNNHSREMLKSLLIAINEKEENPAVEHSKKGMGLVFPKVRKLEQYYENLKGKLDYKKYKNSFKYDLIGLIRGERHIYTRDVKY